MLIEIPEDKNEYRSIWDKPVPILEVNKQLYRMYILEEIHEPVNYGEVIELLADLDESVTVEVYLNTPGGSLDSAVMLVDAMTKCKARMLGKLSGEVASAGTLLTMAMDEIEIAPYTAFMIHAWSVRGQEGKANEIEAYNAFSKKETKRLFHEVYSGFLSSREINKILAGKDVWLNKEEVEVRWAKKTAS